MSQIYADVLNKVFAKKYIANFTKNYGRHCILKGCHVLPFQGGSTAIFNAKTISMPAI